MSLLNSISPAPLETRVKKSGGTPIHRARMKKKPKKVKKTAQELAMERRQTMALDDEIEESEEKFAALTRGKLGRVSLLSGAPRTAAEAANGVRNSGGGSGVGGVGANSRSGTVGLTTRRTMLSVGKK